MSNQDQLLELKSLLEAKHGRPYELDEVERIGDGLIRFVTAMAKGYHDARRAGRLDLFYEDGLEGIALCHAAPVVLKCHGSNRPLNIQCEHRTGADLTNIQSLHRRLSGRVAQLLNQDPSLETDEDRAALERWAAIDSHRYRRVVGVLKWHFGLPPSTSAGAYRDGKNTTS